MAELTRGERWARTAVLWAWHMLFTAAVIPLMTVETWVTMQLCVILGGLLVFMGMSEVRGG